MPSDYIMRMIEEFFRILRNLIQKREDAEYEMAREGLGNLSRMVTGLDLERLKLMGAEGIRHFFNPAKAEDAEKIFCMAKIIKEDGLIYEAEGDIEESKKCFEYSVQLFGLLKDSSVEAAHQVSEEIKELNEKLK